MWASQYSKECQKKYEKSQNVNSKNSQRQTKKKIIHNCSFCDFSVVNEQILNEHILSLHVMPLPLNLENSSSLLDNAPNYLARNKNKNTPKIPEGRREKNTEINDEDIEVVSENVIGGGGGKSKQTVDENLSGSALSRPKRIGRPQRNTGLTGSELLHFRSASTEIVTIDDDEEFTSSSKGRENSKGEDELLENMHLIQCPLCNRSFEKHRIELHASNCQGKLESNTPEVVTIPDDNKRRENSKVAKSDDIELLEHFHEEKEISDFDTILMGEVYICKICQQEFRHLRKFRNHCVKAHSNFDNGPLFQTKGIKKNIRDFEENNGDYHKKGTNIIKKFKPNSRIRLSDKIDNILNNDNFMSFENQFCEVCEKSFPNMTLFEEHKNNFHHQIQTPINQEIPQNSMQNNQIFHESEANLQYDIDPSWYTGHFMSGLIFESPGGPISGTIPNATASSSKRRENSKVAKIDDELSDYFEDLEEIPDFDDVTNDGTENDENIIVLED